METKIEKDALKDLPDGIIPIILFDKTTGNTNNYRIPALCQINDNNLIACCDERFFGCGDNPNRIDKVIKISQDNGISWGPQITVVKERGTSKLQSAASIDPALLYDAKTQTIFMLYSHTPAGIGLLNCKKSTGYRNGYKTLTRKGEIYEIRKNEIFYKNKPTGITVDTEGNLSSGGNFSDKTSEYIEIPTSYLMITCSRDGGNTWEKPRCLNLDVKSPSWAFIGACPGAGIQVSKGKHKDRLIFPIYYSRAKMLINLTFSCIYSDDFGETWKNGSSPWVKGRFTQKNPIIIPARSWLSETQVVETSENEILAVIRNHHPKKRAMFAISQDGGTTFGKTGFFSDIPQPICQISAISFDHAGKRFVAIMNAASEKKRENGTIRLSIDGGRTYPYSKLLVKGEFAYSSMAYLTDGYIGIMYEDNLNHENIKFMKIRPEEITEQL